MVVSQSMHWLLVVDQLLTKFADVFLFVIDYFKQRAFSFRSGVADAAAVTINGRSTLEASHGQVHRSGPWNGAADITP